MMRPPHTFPSLLFSCLPLPRSRGRRLKPLSSKPPEDLRFWSAAQPQRRSLVKLMNKSRHFTHLSSRFALVFIGALALTRTISAAETPSAPIPFGQVGAKATADYHGDAIGIDTVTGGAQLHTAFQKLSGSVTSDGLRIISTDDKGGELHLIASAIGKKKLASRGKVVVRRRRRQLQYVRA